MPDDENPTTSYLFTIVVRASSEHEAHMLVLRALNESTADTSAIRFPWPQTSSDIRKERVLLYTFQHDEQAPYPTIHDFDKQEDGE